MSTPRIPKRCEQYFLKHLNEAAKKNNAIRLINKFKYGLMKSCSCTEINADPLRTKIEYNSI